MAAASRGRKNSVPGRPDALTSRADPLGEADPNVHVVGDVDVQPWIIKGDACGRDEFVIDACFSNASEPQGGCSTETL